MNTKIAICLALWLSTHITYAQQSPNIIVFIVDDMGWQDTAVPFWNQSTSWNTRYHTPAMERLAKEGMKFTNAYAAPVCTPSRVSLLTGMNAAHHRVTNWTLRKNQSVDEVDSLLQSPNWNVNGLSPLPGIEHSVYATPLPQLLQQQGYYTIHCGKAHFGAMETPGADPLQLGFIKNIAGHAAGGLGSYLGEKNYGNQKGMHTLPWGVPGLEAYHGSDIFLTEALTREALQALDSPVKKKQPFFLYMAHYAVHIPYAADKRFINRYISMGLPPKEAEYAALVEGMDKSLGDLLNYLDEKGISNNTVIFFVSDNGGFTLQPRAGAPFTQNTPLRSGKGSVYEGGIRVPMLVKYPGITAPGSICNQPVIIEDFFPTLLSIAGNEHPKMVQSPDGKNLLPLLHNSQTTVHATRKLIWHFPNKWIPDNTAPGINYHSAIREGKWKLVYNMRNGEHELYDIDSDIEELHNLAKENPTITNRLSRYMSEQLRKWNADMPIVKASGKRSKMADGKE
ncbi:MAG: sulfatase [Sediminibacterium sp.]|nr:sulfatase [Sediminibacterium sp.]